MMSKSCCSLKSSKVIFLSSFDCNSFSTAILYRKEKAESAKSLGEVIKRYRTQRKMTQEFVAESLGVSRQAVSKWESGASDPSTTNLMALAKLFGVTAEEILKEVK